MDATPPTTEAIEIRPHPGPQEQFLSSGADIVIYGGAAGGGKSWAAIVEPLRHIDNPEFGTVILRRTFPEIRNEGGLWDESLRVYPYFGGRPSHVHLKWTFPSGATVQFGHCQHEDDVLKWHGSQICLLVFDELTHFTEKQFFYLLSRNRSTCGVRPYVRATCNPDVASWVARFIDWWIDPRTGYAYPQRSGITRRFHREGGQIVWEDIESEAGKDEKNTNGHRLSLSFIRASIFDNPTLIEKNPEYLANLESLPYVERERLLGGNWKISDSEGKEFDPSWFAQIWDADYWPDKFEVGAIALDPSEGRDDGDYAAIVFVGVSGGKFWVDADIRRVPAETAAVNTIEMYDELSPHVIGVEKNNTLGLMGKIFDHECGRQNRGPLPLVMLNNTVRKQLRIRRLSPYLRRHKVRFRHDSPGCRLLEMQLRAFPQKDVHDDGPDAFEMAVRMLNWVVTGKTVKDRDLEYAI